MDNEKLQINSGDEVRVLPEEERIDRVLKYELQLPDDITQLPSYKNAVEAQLLPQEEIAKTAKGKVEKELPETKYYESSPRWHGGYGFIKIRINGKEESVFVAGSNIKQGKSGQKYDGEGKIYFSEEDLKFGPNKKGGQGWSLGYAITDKELYESWIRSDEEKRSKKLTEEIEKLMEPERLKNSWIELAAHWPDIKSKAENLFAGGNKLGSFEINGHKYWISFNGGKKLVDVDSTNGPIIEEDGQFKISIEGSGENSIEVAASITQQGWHDAEFGNIPFVRDDVVSRKDNSISVAMHKHGVNFEVVCHGVFDTPSIHDYSNTITITQNFRAVTPIGEIKEELKLFDARTSEMTDDLPVDGIGNLITQAAKKYQDLLGISPDLIRMLLQNEIDVNKLTSLEDAIDLYLQIKKYCGTAKDFDIYDGKASMFKIISDLLNPKYVAKFYAMTSSLDVESNDGGLRTISLYHYYANTEKIDGVEENDLGSSSLDSATIEKMDKAGLLWEPRSNSSDREKTYGPSLTISQRIELAKILLENEFILKNPDVPRVNPRYDDGIYHKLVWWKQYEILSKALELANNIDFNSKEKSFEEEIAERFNVVKKWIERVDKEINSIQRSYDRDEDLSFRKKKLVDVKNSLIRSFPEAGNIESIQIENLTDANLVGIERASKYISEELQKTDEHEEYVFEDQPIPTGTRTIARVTKSDGKLKLSIENIPSELWKIEKIENDIAPHRTKVGDTKTTFIVEENEADVGSHTSSIILSEGLTSLENGEYPIEVISMGRKFNNRWKISVLSTEFLANEEKEISDEVRNNLPIRKLGVRISGIGRDDLYGMPVDKDGKPAIDEKDIDHWVLYQKYNKWENAYPEVYILVPFVGGIRSKSSGKTFEELVKDYNR